MNADSQSGRPQSFDRYRQNRDAFPPPFPKGDIGGFKHPCNEKMIDYETFSTGQAVNPPLQKEENLFLFQVCPERAPSIR